VSHCRRTLRGEGHSAAGWGTDGSVIAADCGVQSPFIRAMGGPLTALRHVVSLPVSTPLRIVNHSWSGFLCKWRYITAEAFNLYFIGDIYIITLMLQWTGGPCPFYIFNAPPMNSSSDCLATTDWTSSSAAAGGTAAQQVC